MKSIWENHSGKIIVLLYVGLFTCAALGILPEWVTRFWYE